MRDAVPYPYDRDRMHILTEQPMNGRRACFGHRTARMTAVPLWGRWGVALGVLVVTLAAVGSLPGIALAQPHGGFSRHTFKCEQCHNAHMAQGGKILNQPTEQGVCYSCHDGTGSVYNVLNDFGESVIGTSTVRSHHPVPEGAIACHDCHTPHHGPDDGNPMSLAAGPSHESTGNAVCGACHGPGSTYMGGDLLTGFTGTPHDVTMPDPPSGTKIKCIACHMPHGSGNLSLITTSIVDPLGVRRTVDTSSNTTPLCLACHAVATGTFPGEQVALATKHSSAASSTNALTVYPGAQGPAGSCANCHDPHGAGGNEKYLRASGNALCGNCHDASGLSRTDDYSYRGGTAYAASPHSGASGSVYNVLHSDSAGFAAWESTAVPTPSSPGTPMPTSTVNALMAADGDYARTALADQTGQSDYQMYRFKLPNDGAGVQSLKTTWVGYGSAVAGYPVTTYLWDDQAGSWSEYAQAMAAQSKTMTTATTSPSRFVDGSGYVWVLARAAKAVDADIVTTPVVLASADGSVTVTWSTLGLSDGYVDFGTDVGPPYGSSVGTSTLTTTHTATFAPPTADGIVHFRVRGTDASGLSRATTDTAFALPTVVMTPVGAVTNTGNHDTVVPTTIQWTMAEAARAPYTYQLKVTGDNGYSYTSSWLTTNTATLNLGYSWYRARVMAKDKNGQVTAWSPDDLFNVYYTYYEGGSCPFLFTWDGLGFRFEADNFTAGRIGGTVSTGYQQPNPNDAYVLSTPPASKDGQLEFKLVEERYEVDYLDTYKLYSVDAPAGTKVFAEKAVAGKRTFPPLQSALHTTRNLHAPVAASRTDTWQDVLGAVSAEDGTFLELNESQETSFTYKTVELDLGADALAAPQVKVVMDAITEFPVTPEGVAHRAQFGLPQKLEVQDTDGSWRAIPAASNPLPTPPEFSRPYVFDLTSAVAGTTGKVRFTFLFRTLIDYIGIDTTQDEWLTVAEMPSAGADLAYHGVDQESGTADIKRFDYGVGVRPGEFYAGAYTRYGDVTPLLAGTDDKFVVMGQGDELTLRYQQPAAPAEGVSRQYVFSAYGYYKDRKTDLPAQVEPLPFQAMSNYPYPASESYPADAEHQAYLAEYNTRAVAESAAPAAPAMTEQAVAPENAPHRSVNADVVMIEAGFPAGGQGSCNQCHAVHGAADASGTAFPSLTFAPESSTCLGNGTETCHATAEASAGNEDVQASLTATGNPNAHHDLAPGQGVATGSKLKCSDCHDPHSDTPASPFKDPTSIGTTMALGYADFLDENGDFYALVGSQHDAVPPTITNVSIDVASHPATAPAFTWSTNELATSRVDLGTTEAYELGAYGTDALSAQHSVVTSDLAIGTVYHYRVRSADAMGNSTVSQDATFTPVAASATPTLTPAPSGYEWTDYTFTWSAVTAPDGDPVEYQATLTNGASTYDFGWSTANSWAVTGLPYGDWTWKVRSRDASHAYAVSAWSPLSAFSNYTPSSTCPYLFTWDGTKYGFETDLYGQGKLAIKRATGYLKPAPEEAYVLQNEPAAKDGYLDFRMVEERSEVNYLDEWALYSADVPDGYDLYTERPQQGSGPFKGLNAVVHTARTDAAPPASATWVNTGDDVRDLIASSDGQRLLLNQNRNQDYNYQTLELDLSNTLGAPQTKLLLDAQTMFPNSPEGYARIAQFGYVTRLEVQDLMGNWVKVPSSVCPMPPPAEFYRPHALDITNIWQSTSRKVRLTFLYKTYVDSIRVDTTLDQPVNLTKLPLHSATLQQHGRDAVSAPGDFYEYVYGEPNEWTHYFPGDYTKFGTVSPLLATGGDDKYVIFGGGDEIAAQFELPQAAPAGTQRKYVAFVDGWYKDPKSDCPKTVDPLPFHAMSTFPYPAGEQYPTDAEHQQYLQDWNTRYESGTTPAAAPSAPATEKTGILGVLKDLFSLLFRDEPAQTVVADARPDFSLSFERGPQEPVRGPYSVDTDAASLLRTGPDGSVTTVDAAAGWESSGATPTPSSPGSAVDATTLSRASSVNGSYWRTDVATADRSWNFQVMRFRVATDAIGATRQLAFQWTGHGELTVGYPTFVSVWNNRTSSWQNVYAPADTATDRGAGWNAPQATTSFCLKCHSGTTPPGVTVPAGVANVGSQWNASGQFHAGVASGGYGGGLKVPYARGQAVPCSACHTSHGGTNIYHIPSTVNGTTGIAVTNGVSAKALCVACHTGTVQQWHQQCDNCHEGAHGDYGFTPTDASDCLACHGHNRTFAHYEDASCHCGTASFDRTF